MTTLALQDICAPDGVCFGCGSANPDGLQIKSFWSDDGQFVVAKFVPKPHMTGYAEWLYGGIIASLIDCHSNWTAMAFTYRAEGREPGSLPRITCVTGTLGVKYLKPTPIGATIHLKGWMQGHVGKKNHVLCEVHAETNNGEMLQTAMGDSIFIRVENPEMK